MRFRIIIALLWCAVSMANSQGTLRAELFPFPSSTLPVRGEALYYMPSLVGVDEGDLLSMSYAITINTNVLFNQAHIFGGSTAIGYILAEPVPDGNGLLYAGTTQVVPHQVRTMLAGLTQIELINASFNNEDLRGSLVAVPEPSNLLLLAFGTVAFAASRFLKRR